MKRLSWVVVCVLGLGCGDASFDGVPSAGGRSDVGGGMGGDPIPPGQLTAGEWRDIDHWELWTELVGADGPFETFVNDWGVDTTGRVGVLVRDASGPVSNAAVALLDDEGNAVWNARTDVRGEAELFASTYEPSVGPYTVAVADTSVPVELNTARVTIELESAIRPRRALDLMFVIDTTGSMSDELGYIQAELENVIERSRETANQEFDLRLSVNLYRDEGDEYVVRSSPFSADPTDAIAMLKRDSAQGGGDWPEAVDAALDDAIFDHEWSEDATARILFLVLDAPPHAESETKMERLRAALQAGAERGVRVIPVSGTGVDQNTEALLRSMAIVTGGTYAFLTDHSGIGGDHLEPTVGEYDVEFLNDLMTRLVVEAIDP